MPDPFIDVALDDDPDTDLYTSTVTRTSGSVTQVSWTDTTTAKLFKTTDITRTSGRVSSVVTKVYDKDGTTIIAQKTLSFTRTGGLVTSLTSTRNV